MSKQTQLLALARKRKRARWPGFGRVADYHGGVYDCNHVSPYTKSAANLDSKVFVLLQDWSSHAWLSRPLNPEVQRLGYAPGLPTNRNLAALLKSHFRLSLADVYATNLFPFIKCGGLSGGISDEVLVRAAREYALPQIRIVQPALVICLGLATANAVRESCGQSRAENVAAAVSSPFEHAGVLYWAQAHPGHFGQISRNKSRPAQVRTDWQQMKRAFDAQA